MVWRLSETSTWQLVRRVPLDYPWTSVIASPEGTVLVRGIDPATVTEEYIVAYMIDGTDFVVWREADSAFVRAYNGDQMLPGPLQ